MKALLTAVRIIVGVLFIFSGLIKANDPLGLAYKMDEYFAVWGFDWASDYSLFLSITMNVFEIVAGIAILLGFAPRLFTWLLLLLIIFFTFLTGYAVFSGKIKTCGCFGDCIPLEAYQSFIKDLVLLVLIVFLFIKRNAIRAFLPARINLIIILFFMGFFSFGQMNVLKHLPYVDCLPYAQGKNLIEQMEPPAGANPDSTTIIYTYTKDGKDVSFDINNFPDDFDDEVYTNMRRKDVLVRKGNATPKIADFALYSASNEDTTKQFLSQEGFYILFFAKDFDGTQPKWLDMFGKIYLKAKQKQVPMFLVTNEPAKAEAYFNQSNHFAIPVLRLDGTVMKTVLRTKVGLVTFNGPVVAGKYAEQDMNDIIKVLNQRSK
jgi:uncharacterized membrane protein YphA (DoxX/SURF4 family)